MLFQVKVRVNLNKMQEFGQKLMKGELDRSCIKSETFCLKDDPAVGFSIWEAADRHELDVRFNPWRSYYQDVEITEVITAQEAQKRLMEQRR